MAADRSHDDCKRQLVEATESLNAWLNASSHADKSSPQSLAEHLQKIESSPQIRRYKQCHDLDAKFRFLWSVGCVIRAVKDGSGPVGRRVASNTHVIAAARRLEACFFVLSQELPSHGSVLGAWHGGRLRLYNTTLWLAGKRAATKLKDELQVRLVAALKAAAPATNSQGQKRTVEMHLRRWPMVGCPLGRAFLEFLSHRSSELGNLGHISLSDCPPYSLQPTTLKKLLRRLDAFDVVVSEDDPPTSAGLVRLNYEGVQALASKAVGTKPKASAPGPAITTPPARGKAPPSSSSVAARGGAQLPDAARRAPGSKSSGSTLGLAAKGVAGPKLVRRRIDWSNDRSMRQIVRRGLSAGDAEWTQNWADFCGQRGISADLAATQGNGPPKDAVAEFVEQNLTVLLKRDWAKELMFKIEGQNDELPPDSDGENVTGAKAIPVGAAASNSIGGDAPASPNAKASGSAMGQVKRLAPSAPGVAGSASGDRHNGSSAGLSDHEYSTGSESSRSRQRRKKRKKDKKKKGLLSYGDLMKGISPEVMMMNQMMGMSMMMNNPLAMGMMGASMMPGMQQMLGVKSSKKDDKKKTFGRIEENVKRDELLALRDRDRKREKDGTSETGSSTALPPPPPRPATANPMQSKTAPPGAGSDAAWKQKQNRQAMIDADDL